MRIENDTDAAGVAEVVATFVSGTLNDLIHATGGERTIVADDLLLPGYDLSGEEIRRRTFDELPRYAVPSEISVRGALPLTRSGKRDRRAMQRAWEGDPDDHA
jgi:acyl-coenzyme A synthetase/AMP-(fatty) acid ligase